MVINVIREKYAVTAFEILQRGRWKGGGIDRRNMLGS